MVRKLFTEHPASVGETYGQHCVAALRFGTTMVGAGIACMVHAFLPFLFCRTGSHTVTQLHVRMIANRVATCDPRAVSD